jgi:hypothetical protein
VSRASENPVHCADLSCTASHPGSRFDAIKADAAGWFHSKAEELAWCPEHVPGWVPVWRAKRAAEQHTVKGSFTKLPAVLACGGCKLTLTEESEDPDLLRALRDVAFGHGRETGHRVTVTTTQELAVEPVS